MTFIAIASDHTPPSPQYPRDSSMDHRSDPPVAGGQRFSSISWPRFWRKLPIAPASRAITVIA
jgi:hypothetical protein